MIFVRLKHKLYFFIAVVFFIFHFTAGAQKVPGVIINHVPASTGIFIGSPSICILPNGGYIASNDYFGPNSNYRTKGTTVIFKSSNKGKSWREIAVIKGQLWSNLFLHNNYLYLMGTDRRYGDFVIRRSKDGGITWSSPTDSTNGILLKGEYHTAPTPTISYNGFLWRAIENPKPPYGWGGYGIVILSVPANADLLDAANWRHSDRLPSNPTWLNSNFSGWLEGNVVPGPNGNVIDILRVESKENGKNFAAVVNIDKNGLASLFDPSTGFVPFNGGETKFTIRYDKRSNKYWTISNFVTNKFLDMNGGSVRNTLVLKSSDNLRNWVVHKVLLKHKDVYKHGFQYVDWQFDGRDIIFVSRTAYDDQFGGAGSFHDANYMTFHRIKNFRKLGHKKVKF